MFYDKDADLSLIQGKTVAIIGFGSQGHAHAQNLRDSGVTVVVSELKGTPNGERAEKAGFEVLSAAEATRQADVIMMLVPDQTQAVVYRDDVAPNLKEDATLMFAHGSTSTSARSCRRPRSTSPWSPPRAPVISCAVSTKRARACRCSSPCTRTPAARRRRRHCPTRAPSAACAPAVSRRRSRKRPRPTSSASRPCSAAAARELVTAGFETLVEAGYQPEIAYFECLHELKLIVDLTCRRRASPACATASATPPSTATSPAARASSTTHVRETMAEILGEIQSGEFAREWIIENQANRPVYNALKRQGKEHLIETVGKELRGMMSWIDEGGFDIDV